MEISKNFSRYDSAISPNQELYKSNNIPAQNSIKSFLDPYKLDISSKALSSSLYNDSSNKFPTYNEDVLQYDQNLELTLKP